MSEKPKDEPRAPRNSMLVPRGNVCTKNQGLLEMFVIYERPRDFPDSYVLRRWYVRPGETEPTPDVLPLAVDLKLENVRARVPPRAVMLHGRGVDPDPVIIEVWL